ncbi:hypothetical protein RBH20_18295 [Haloarcula sp. H-GB4]|uniref:COG1361 S-layer family protein n=1 Tax=Haloarcula sp. H-GB4 TaxID=3069755 RepID=UPI0027B63254|nr:hypothetical protein [Haloarcula sp. H-GB4]MDQ2074486.1 hypothetical protein [Haloarcula sp. H-GB4]
MSRLAAGAKLLTVVIVCSLLASTVALGFVEGSPELSASLAENRIVAGEEATLEVMITNAGELETMSTTNPELNQRVLTATGISTRLRADDAPLSVTTRRQSVGSIADGGEQVVPFTISVDEDASPGTYRLPLRVTYTHTAEIDEGGGFSRTRTVEETLSVTVRVVERARFSVVDTEGDLGPASVGTVSVTLENVGSEVANETSVSLASLDPDVQVGSSGSSSQYAGAWEPGQRRTLTYVVAAADTATNATYPFRVTTAFDDDRGVRRTDESGVVGVEPQTGRRFVVTDVNSDVAAGGSGTLAVTLRNDGPRTSDATLALRSTAGTLTIDGGGATTRFVGDWPAGAERTVTVGVTTPSGTEGGTYTLDATVDYRTDGGVDASARPANVGVTVVPDPDFSVRDAGVSLAVGEEGKVRGTVVNNGTTPARNAVVVISAPSSTVRFAETTYAVGDLDAGSSADFAFDAAVAPTGEAGPRPFDVTVRYEGPSGDDRQSAPLQVRGEVAPQPDRLAFEAVNASYGIDTSNRLRVRATNVGDTRLEDVRVTLVTAPPFTSESPGAFVSALNPGETATLGFELTVSEDAVESTHAVAFNATAKTADGDVVRTEPSLVPVAIAEPTGPGGDTAIVAGAAVLAAVVIVSGWWWLRQ